mmetsp:Transcript_63090/g.141860  ORF Transcript_63090/g.141860 Transcript_63090/m.141860 type:complete len:202 (+) Transcript_63090:143-748(+)
MLLRMDAMRALLSGVSGRFSATIKLAKPSLTFASKTRHCPKSMRPTRPSGTARKFPGCGSPWKQGQKKIWKPWRCTRRCSLAFSSAVVLPGASRPRQRRQMSRSSASTAVMTTALRRPRYLESTSKVRLTGGIPSPSGAATFCSPTLAVASLPAPGVSGPLLSMGVSPMAFATVTRVLASASMPRALRRATKMSASFGPGT